MSVAYVIKDATSNVGRESVWKINGRWSQLPTTENVKNLSSGEEENFDSAVGKQNNARKWSLPS